MKLLFLSIIAATMLAALPTHAQRGSSLIHHTIVKSRNTPPSMGRDLWFAVPSNEWGVQQISTYIQIYITSQNNTTAYVSCEGTTSKIAVNAYVASTFTVPEFWENESSGEIEDKAIHVWSNDADLSVYFLSNQFESGDGSYIIPSIGWGTDYVVAAYGSLYNSSGDGAYDLPSECVVVANQDNTQVEITPSCDCRNCTSGNINGDVNSTIVMYPAGQVAMFNLNRGQDVEMMPVKAADAANFDMTGTIIHANQPVGVLGASMAPEIPAGFPYPDFVCEMLPPTRTWGETYYATNYLQPPGQPSHDYVRYLFIATLPGQTIFGHNCTMGDYTEWVNTGGQYACYWDEKEFSQMFFSDAPFLCVSYINSSTYPDGINEDGDPAEAIIIPKEQFINEIVFETPSGTEFTNYANIIFNINDAKEVTFDGKPILGLPSGCIDDTFAFVSVEKIAPGVHRVTSDSGAGVLIYGYGNDESYAWSTPASCGSFHSPDTIPPEVDTIGECFGAVIHVTDSGLTPGIYSQTGLNMIRLDTSYNMTYLTDEPPFVEGSGQDTTGYGMFVTDPSKPAILVVEIYDMAGNETKVTSIYTPVADTMVPPQQNLGVWHSGLPGANIAYDTIYNTGTVPFDITELQLLKGNVGFTLHDSIGRALDLSPLPAGGRRIIQIQFEAIQPTHVVDSILFGEPPCILQSVALVGSGGSNDFIVSSQDWVNEPYNGNPVSYTKTVEIDNLSENPITIDKASWSDSHFTAVTTFPVTVPKSPGKVAFAINYTPDATSLTPLSNRTLGTWTSPQVLASGGSESPRFDSLIGNAVAASETFTDDTTITVNCASSGETVTAYLTITETGTANGIINRVTQTNTTDFSLFGTLEDGTTWDPTKQAELLPDGQSAVISVEYTVPDNPTISVVDYITATDGNGDTIGGRPLKVTVNVNYAEGSVNPSLLNFGPINFQSQNVILTQKSFLITNTANAPMTIDNLLLQPGGNYNPAFTITTQPPVTFPYTLPIAQSLTVFVDFNDSTSDDPQQSALLEVVGNTCDEIVEELTGSIANSGVQQTVIPTINATIIPSEDGRSMEIIFPPDLIGTVNFQLVNVLGESILRSTLGTGTQNVDASSLPRGVYFYRLTSGAMNQSGKVILGE